VVKIGLYMTGSPVGVPSSAGFVPAHAAVLQSFSESIEWEGGGVGISHIPGYARPIRPEVVPPPNHAA
jgi:hypothetical protein